MKNILLRATMNVQLCDQAPLHSPKGAWRGNGSQRRSTWMSWWSGLGARGSVCPEGSSGCESACVYRGENMGGSAGSPGWLCVPVTVCTGSWNYAVASGLVCLQAGDGEAGTQGTASGRASCWRGPPCTPVCMFSQVDFHPALPEGGAG